MKDILILFAQRIGTDEVPGIPVATGDEVLASILNAVYFLAGIIAVISLILAGIAFINSGGDSGKVAKAKNQILYSVIGIVLVVSAFAITNFVIGRF